MLTKRHLKDHLHQNLLSCFLNRKPNSWVLSHPNCWPLGLYFSDRPPQVIWDPDSFSVPRMHCFGVKDALASCSHVSPFGLQVWNKVDVVITVQSWEVFMTYLGLPWWLSGKNLPDIAGDADDVGSIPGSGNPLEKEMATHSRILDWEIP